jgi:hypothetical protein
VREALLSSEHAESKKTTKIEVIFNFEKKFVVVILSPFVLVCAGSLFPKIAIHVPLFARLSRGGSNGFHAIGSWQICRQ